MNPYEKVGNFEMLDAQKIKGGLKRPPSLRSGR
jgi:hypothetical protein